MWPIIYNHIKHINNVQELYIGALLDVTGEVTDEIHQKIHLYFISKFSNWRVSSRISPVGEKEYWRRANTSFQHEYLLLHN